MNPRAADSHWFVVPRPVDAPRVRLFCLPYVGGGASIYRRWSSGLPDDVELCAVQLPGRETRADEDPFDDIGALVDALELAVDPYLGCPFALFGHSMGAIVALELAHRLAKRGEAPMHLFVSGRAAPHLWVPPNPLVHTLPEPEFIENIKALSGTPEGLFDDPELRRMFVPLLRADFTLIERWQYKPCTPLDVPLTAFGGNDDQDIPAAMIEGWSEHTRASFVAHMLDGGHFFIRPSREAVVRELARVLGPAAPKGRTRVAAQ